ncbi:MAG: hypothetical protein ACRDAM_05010 [Casimicrobium sp.]
MNARAKSYTLLAVLVAAIFAIGSGAIHMPRAPEYCDMKPRKAMKMCQIEALNEGGLS